MNNSPGLTWAAALCLTLAALSPRADAQTQPKDAGGWKTIFATKGDLKDHPEDQVNLEKGLLHVRAPQGLFVPQPTADGALRARLHFLPGTANPQLRIRKNGDGKNAAFYMLLIRTSADTKEIKGFELNLTAPNAGKGLGTATLEKPVALGGFVDLELSTIGNHIKVLVNGKTALELDNDTLSTGGSWGLASGEAWFSNVQIRSGAGSAGDAKGPAAVAVGNSGDPRLTQLETVYAAAHQREVSEPHQQSVTELNSKYAVALDRAMEAAKQTGNLDGVVALREEKDRLTKGEPIPEEDIAILKSLRTTYRTALSQLNKQSEQRLKPLRDKFIKELDIYQADLTRAGEIDKALAARARKERELPPK